MGIAMKTRELSSAALWILGEAGWSPERRVDADLWRWLHESNGHTLHPVAEEFLRSVGGLTLACPHPTRSSRRDAKYELDPRVAFQENSSNWLKMYEEYFQRPLSFLGVEFYSVLLMDSEARVYSAFEWAVVCEGVSVEDFMNSIAEGRSTRELPEPPDDCEYPADWIGPV